MKTMTWREVKLKLQQAAYDGERNLSGMKRYFHLKKDRRMVVQLHSRPLSSCVMLNQILSDVDISELVK